VGLPDVTVLGVVDDPGASLVVYSETRTKRAGCPECGTIAVVKDRSDVALVDLPCFGRPNRLVWRKRRWHCPDPDCEKHSWTEEDRRIAAPRMAMTDRVGRWLTAQIGSFARSVSEVADELGCDWHTVNDTLVRYGEALLDEPGRFANVTALGLDGVLVVRRGEYRHQEFATSIADVQAHQLLDVVPGRTAKKCSEWIDNRSAEWRQAVRWGTRDLAGTDKSVFDASLAHVTQVADPFHVVKHANSKLDECRRRVHNETLGHRGRKDDPLYRCQRPLTKAHERIDDKGNAKLVGLLKAWDPKGEVTVLWHAKEAVRGIYDHSDESLAREWVDQRIDDLGDNDQPIEARSRGRTLKRWKEQIVAWHRSQVTNGPTESANNLITRVKRAAFGCRKFRNFRVRALLYAGKPRWSLLATIEPR